MKQKTLNHLSVLVAILTFVGIALHDTKIDKLTAIAIATPVIVAAYEGAQLMNALRGESHTHVERVSIDRTASRNTSWMPHLQTRKTEDDRYKSDAKNNEGYHPFDDHTLPVLA